MRLVFEVKQPLEQLRQLGAIWSRLAQQIRRVTVVVTTMTQAKAGTADRVGRSDPGQDCKPGRDIEILVPITFA
jgi:hypothetical protein